MVTHNFTVAKLAMYLIMKIYVLVFAEPGHIATANLSYDQIIHFSEHK